MDPRNTPRADSAMREILNLDLLKDCLEDPGLLALGVLIPVTPDHDDLAVTVGGKRRDGGF